MLPQFLWAIVVSFLLADDYRLSFDTPVTVTGKNFSTTSAPALFSLPSSSSEVTISLALCAAASTNPPRVFVSNSSDSQVVPGPNGGADVFGVQIGGLGLGNFTLGLSSESTAGVLAVYGGAPSDSLEIGVTQGTTPLHAPVQDLPFFGDSTANEVLLFSPPFLPPEPAPQPTFPNYMLPQANISLPSASPSQNSPNFTLFLAPLSAGLSALPQTACAIRAGVMNNTQAAQSAKVLAEQLWLRDELGWRKEWLVGLLTPLTNYSVYAIQDGTRLGGPIYFTTKSASFSCQLVHALPYCPTTAYAVPLPAPPARALAYDSSNLPTSLTAPLFGYLTNFTTSLLTTACGRDAYSPLQSCADCQAAYRRWLCSISLPRCGEFPQTPSDPQQQQQQTLAVPAPALVPQMSGMTPRNAALGNASNYTALLPCIETCNAVDRACPVFLGFRCPLPQFTAYASYGVGYIDSADGQVKDGGVPGVPQDQWGNVFCNVS
ncbi:stretch-activated Ca2+-permeable channel component-domain-containing protein [Lactarius akahatsu]|uniref:Stretch-activated Ca2+-permeable channel component-domain-containing protein n=1 Tax=Lactarius akahatsu TaxID=416441 RepID=A0AAD4LK70_9AGAM|nr:stretch-activated Ca2+-permeable channel component-domain-containing protein [Lactarius akahatsu]